MYFGLAISFALHAGLLAWAVANLHSAAELPMPESPTIESELVTLSEFTKLKQGDPQAKELEAKAKENPEPQISKKEAPKPKPETAEPPPAAEPPQAEEPEPPKPDTPEKSEPQKEPEPAEQPAGLPPPPSQPSPEEAQKLEAERQAKAKAKAEAERKKKEAEKKKKEAARKKEAERKKKIAEEKRRQQAKEKESFADQMAALIDKTPEKRGAPRSAQEPSKPTDYEGPTAGERQGQGNQLTAREADLLKGQISAQLRNCWRLPGGGGGIEAIVVTLKWRLREDGALDGYPEVQNGRSDPVFQAAARAAVAAVTECAPFNLPRESFTAWRTIIWDFDPRHML